MVETVNCFCQSYSKDVEKSKPNPGLNWRECDKKRIEKEEPPELGDPIDFQCSDDREGRGTYDLIERT